MFKIGDRVINKNGTNLGLHWEVKEISFDGKMILKNDVDFLGIDNFSTITKNWIINKDYYRKLKLKKICSKLEI